MLFFMENVVLMIILQCCWLLVENEWFFVRGL